jgi:NAD(P)-dependent dehydrogenase (short-subunit alcohol dehydrogenase family)
LKPENKNTLQGRQVVLAGGAGGLGSATAHLLYEQGAHLVVSYRSNSDRAAALSHMGEIVQADLSQTEDRTRLLEAAPELYGLVVFAGDPARVTGPAGLEEAMGRSWSANYLGPVLLAREAAARMREQNVPGAIVLFSTMQAMTLFAGSTAYAGAKAALIHSARLLAKECRGSTNIRVNVVSPGVMAAGMAEASIAAGKYDRFLTEDTIPRFGLAEDIARTVRFLLEPDNYITGQVLAVDGGLTL